MADPAPDAPPPAAPAAVQPPATVPFVPPVLAALTPTVAQVAQPAAPPPAAPSAPSADSRLRAALLRSEVTRLAQDAGAINPADVLAFTRDDFDLTDDGEVVLKADPRVPVADHLRKLLASKPYLLKPLAPSGGSPASAVVQPPVAQQRPDLTTADGLTALARSFAARAGYRRAP